VQHSLVTYEKDGVEFERYEIEADNLGVANRADEARKALVRQGFRPTHVERT
jgi:hypothetical protein